MELFLLAALLFWLVPALATGYLAAEKGRNTIGWFLFGLFFGLIALILIVVLGPGERGHSGDSIVEPFRRALRWLFDLHPAALLAALDTIGLLIASYLSITELSGGLPVCGPLRGCQEVAQSPYSRIDGIPVAVFGVILSVTLLTLALAWWKTDDNRLLAAHYGLSLVGVMFEFYFTYLELFVIHAVCVWCATYGISLLLRFLVSLTVWVRRPGGRFDPDPFDEPEAI
jgi:uncharacterized membrane protein